jgi:hypothetical protein
MEERYTPGTLLFVEVGGWGKILLLNCVSTEKVNLVTVTPAGQVPFQGGELPLIEKGTVGKNAVEHYIFSYLKKTSNQEVPKITVQRGYFLATEGEGIYTTEKPPMVSCFQMMEDAF